MSIEVLYLPKTFYTSQNKFLATPLVLSKSIRDTTVYFTFGSSYSEKQTDRQTDTQLSSVSKASGCYLVLQSLV